ncbi:MAG: type II toxin-antitoxin system VapC family toxin [Synergistaceae bacterium]|jgi:tRNA(fMet)-specific endonuclease VapC|nr:type II toxin-antitoxin system VapC family toxin [Synergistaceae bacterium]
MPDTYMLDTDICGYAIREKPTSVVCAFWKYRDDKICISSVTYAELMYGAIRSGSAKITASIERFVNYVGIVDFDDAAGKEYAQIRYALETCGTPLAIADLLIASCAKAKGAVLVTNNTKHFGRIPNLKIENWTH